MVKEYEENIIAPAPQFKINQREGLTQECSKFEENIMSPPVELRDDHKQIKTTKLEMTALQEAVRSYDVDIKHQKDPLLQLHNTCSTH